jgi:ketosteroid isomerase-like protein
MTDETAVTHVLVEYYQAFSTLDIQAIVPYFHQPALLIAPQGVAAVPTSTDLVAIFAPVMEALRTRGYGRSELNLQQVKVLSATAALASGVALRYKTDGQELERVGIAYLLHKTDTGWKIVVMIVLHDTDGVARSE